MEYLCIKSYAYRPFLHLYTFVCTCVEMKLRAMCGERTTYSNL